MSRSDYVTDNRFAADVEATVKGHLQEVGMHLEAGRKCQAIAILTQYFEWRLCGAGEPFEGADRLSIRLMQDLLESLA
jgi:hypothetical protein